MGRCENYLNGRPDFEDTLKRCKAYAKAGADVIFALGLNTGEEIRTLCREVGVPVNVAGGQVREYQAVIDPQKLARFPIRAGQLMTAMFLVGVLWVPGIASIIASLMTGIAWVAHPLSALVALVCLADKAKSAARKLGNIFV